MTDTGFPRRDLFRAAGAGALAMTAASYSRVLGANDKVQMGSIGFGGRGAFVTGVFQKNASVKVVAICDVYGARLDAGLQSAPGARGFKDHRKLLEMREVDAVYIATPDHWHAQTAIDALNAGKDVYVEKPLTLRIEEGPPIVKAARVNNRICQVGMQRRSSSFYRAAKRDYMDSGRLGKVTLARTWWHGNTAHLKPVTPALMKQPDNLDWARFLGQVKWRDYDAKQYSNFRAYLEFGGGQVTDLFTHWIDMAHLFLGQDIPVSAVAAGGIYHYKDGRTAPDTVNVLLEYPGEFTATFDATLAPSLQGTGMELCGTKGRLLVANRKFEFYPVEKGDKPVITDETGDATVDHVANFIDCVKSRKLPNADVLIGHRSAQASHLGNIAYVEKRRLKFDPVREEIQPL
jgi:predicted dehydrogenase